MITIRRPGEPRTESMELDEFEARARSGDISPQHEVCFPAVTGDAFVAARDLELYRDLHRAGPILSRRYFHLGRVPYLTLSLIAMLVGVYFGWQKGAPASVSELLYEGGKHRALLIELGQWWRLLSANLLHASGWHLAVNAFFLFNLGGPAEAVFRRLDYALLLLAAALGTTGLSALLTTQASCGASGVVFGAWGGMVVFGLKHKELLPDRYRRYFIGSVVPYSIFTLYLGLAIPGIDNWGHMGGLLAGAGVAAVIPPRLLARQQRYRRTRVALLAITPALLLTTPLWAPACGPGDLQSNRYLDKAGLAVAVPARWQSFAQEAENDHEVHIFDNHAGVVLAIAARLDTRPQGDVDRGARHFIEEELAEQLAAADAVGARIGEAQPVLVHGMPGRRLVVDSGIAGGAARSDYVVLVRGYYRYVISLSAPLWLAPRYAGLLDRILTTVRFEPTDEVERADALLRNGDSPSAESRLAFALAHAGEPQRAFSTLEAAARMWPESPEPYSAYVQLAWEAGQNNETICSIAHKAAQLPPWSPARLVALVDVLRACTTPELASRVLQEALQRYPTDPELLARRPVAAP